MAKDATKALIDGLNEDLAAEFQAVIFYTVAAERMTGLNRPELKELFQREVQDEIGHAQFLAQKVVSLGGEPVTEPKEVKLGGSNRERIELALEAELETIERYRQRVKQADAAGETGLKVRLEEIIADETEHRDQMRLILEGDPG